MHFFIHKCTSIFKCACSTHTYEKWHFMWVHTHDTDTHHTKTTTLVLSVGGGNCIGPFSSQKASSENHPIKISFHLSNHFMRLNKGNASSAVGRELVLLGWFHLSTDWIILTVTLIDLAHPPFLLSTVKYATGTRGLWDIIHVKSGICVNLCVGIALPICLQGLTEDLLGCHFMPENCCWIQ